MFKNEQTVYCLLNGKGTVIGVSEEKNQIKVLFESGMQNIYDKAGRMYFDGNVAGNPTLFAEEPYIITNKALFDVERNIINDKDLIIVGKKGSSLFTAGFYDADNNALYTKDGQRSKGSMFNVISKDMFILKIKNNSNKIKEIREMLKESDSTNNVDNNSDVSLEECGIFLPDEYSTINNTETKPKDIPVNVIATEMDSTENKIEKNAEEVVKEVKYSIPIKFSGANIVEFTDNIVVVDDSGDSFRLKEKNKHFKVVFEKDVGLGVKTVVSIGGDAEHIYKMLLTDIKPLDYINIYDVFIIKPKIQASENEYINVSHSNVKITNNGDVVEINIV
jgi:hypothetical protein